MNQPFSCGVYTSTVDSLEVIICVGVLDSIEINWHHCEYVVCLRSSS